MKLLKEISTISSGQNAPQKEKDYKDGVHCFIKASNLDSVIEDDSESRASHITDEAVQECKLKEFGENTIIFAKSGLSCTKNRVYLTKSKTFLVNHLCAISNIDSNYNPAWLSYFIKAFDVTKLIKDDSYPSISLKEIANIRVPEISMQRQNEVTHSLDSIKEVIKSKKRELSNLDSLVKSLFVEMFNSYGTIDLDLIANITMGQSPDSSSYNDSQAGMPFFQGKGDYGDKYTIVRHYTTSPTKIAHKGAVLMSVRAPVGPVNIASVKCCIGRGLCAIDGIPYKTNNEFLFNALNAMQENISRMGNGSTFKAINKNEVHKLQIPNAPLDQQNHFSTIVSLIDKSRFVIQDTFYDYV